MIQWSYLNAKFDKEILIRCTYINLEEEDYFIIHPNQIYFESNFPIITIREIRQKNFIYKVCRNKQFQEVLSYC